MNADFTGSVAMGLAPLSRLDAWRFLDQFGVAGFRSLQRLGLSSVLSIIEESLLAFALARQSHHPTTGAEPFVINPSDPLVLGFRHGLTMGEWTVQKRKITTRRGEAKRIIGRVAVVYWVKDISFNRIEKPPFGGFKNSGANP